MSDTSTISILDAARRFGVPVRVLRQAIRTGKLPAPAKLDATTGLSQQWLINAESAIAASPKLLSSTAHPKVPPFARYEGTSAWRKYPNRVRAYAAFQASQA